MLPFNEWTAKKKLECIERQIKISARTYNFPTDRSASMSGTRGYGDRVSKFDSGLGHRTAPAVLPDRPYR